MKHSMSARAADYIRLRRNLGYVYKTEAWMLTSFGRYADETARGKPLSVKLAVKWATLPNGERSYHAKRLDALRPFAKHLFADDPRTELIPTGILGSSASRAIPYIFTNDEIKQLMKTDAYAKSENLNNFTFSTIIGLLTSTGMRIGEVLKLQRKNIDWNQRLIMVHCSKKLPMRLLPIDSSVVKALRQYDKCRHCIFPKVTDDTFLLSTKGKACCYQNIKYTWGCLLSKTGIGSNNGNLPRMYDFRHTFACNHLLKAYKNKEDIDASVHTLSVYLGHATVRETYWYLSNVPELMEICSHRFEKFVISRRREGLS